MTALTDTEIQDIRESYELTEEGYITNYGKFEGNLLWVAVAYEESGHGCWEVATSEGDGGAYSEYARICPGDELDLHEDIPHSMEGEHRELQEEDYQVWLALGISTETRALLLHTDSQGFVTGEQATAAELEAWLDRLEREAKIHCPYCGDETEDVEDDDYTCPNGHAFTIEETL